MSCRNAFLRLATYSVKSGHRQSPASFSFPNGFRRQVAAVIYCNLFPTAWAIQAPGLRPSGNINKSRYLLHALTLLLCDPERSLIFPSWSLYLTQHMALRSVQWRQAGITSCDSSCCLFHKTGCTGSGGSRSQVRGTCQLLREFPFLANSKRTLFLRANHPPRLRHCPVEEMDHATLEVNVSLHWLKRRSPRSGHTGMLKVRWKETVRHKEMPERFKGSPGPSLEGEWHGHLAGKSLPTLFGRAEHQ